MKKKPNKIDEFFKLSTEAFESDDDLFYQDMGISKKEYLTTKLKMIKRLKLKSQAQLNKSKNEELLERATQKVKNIIDSTNDNLKKSLESLILEKSPQFQFRNIAKLDENDLKELLIDLNILNVIDDLDKLENDDK